MVTTFLDAPICTWLSEDTIYDSKSVLSLSLRIDMAADPVPFATFSSTVNTNFSLNCTLVAPAEGDLLSTSGPPYAAEAADGPTKTAPNPICTTNIITVKQNSQLRFRTNFTTPQ